LYPLLIASSSTSYLIVSDFSFYNANSSASLLLAKFLPAYSARALESASYFSAYIALAS